MNKILWTIIIIVIIIGGIFFVKNKDYKITGALHKYQNSEYGFYYDGPQDPSDIKNREGKTETDGSVTSTLFLFNPKDGTNNHVTVMRTFKGEKVAVDDAVKNSLGGIPYIGKKISNGVEFDYYGTTDQPAYVTTHGEYTYFIVMFGSEDIKYFGFINN